MIKGVLIVRNLVAVSIFCILAGWSVLVHSYIRTETDVLKYNNLFDECVALRKLNVDSEKAWALIVPFYPEKLQNELRRRQLSFDVREQSSHTSQIQARINHLVEIYLRSHNLAPCGHKECHETVGTFCSISKGTEFYSLYEDLVITLYRGGAIDARACLYLIESEPASWALEEPFFLMRGRIIPSEVSVNDSDVNEKREALIASGFQTAEHWSYDDVRKAILQTKNGESLSDIDKDLSVRRGQLRMTLSNSLVRQIFLLSHWDNPCYQGALDGLIPFVISNLGKDLGVDELNQVKAQINGGEKPELNALEATQIVFDTSKSEAISPSTKIHEVPQKPETDTKIIPAKDESGEVEKVKSLKGSFARAYGGSRFSMNWGNAPVNGGR